MNLLNKIVPSHGQKPDVESGNTTIEVTGETQTTVENHDIEENTGQTSVPSVTIPASNTTKLVILLDNGHASSTPGKRSPDGTFREYEFARDIVKRVSAQLNELGIKNYILVPEVDIDVSLSERARRANIYCDMYGTSNCFFISVHANAAGNGANWMNGRGWSVYTTKGKTKSDEYATILYNEAKKLLPQYGMTLRSDNSDGDPDFEEDFTVIYKTKCPAVLTENLFQDNKTDCDFLKSEIGRQIIAEIHINAIKTIRKQYF